MFSVALLHHPDEVVNIGLYLCGYLQDLAGLFTGQPCICSVLVSKASNEHHKLFDVQILYFTVNLKQNLLAFLNALKHIHHVIILSAFVTSEAGMMLEVQANAVILDLCRICPIDCDYLTIPRNPSYCEGVCFVSGSGFNKAEVSYPVFPSPVCYEHLLLSFLYYADNL